MTYLRGSWYFCWINRHSICVQFGCTAQNDRRWFRTVWLFWWRWMVIWYEGRNERWDYRWWRHVVHHRNCLYWRMLLQFLLDLSIRIRTHNRPYLGWNEHVIRSWSPRNLSLESIWIKRYYIKICYYCWIRLSTFSFIVIRSQFHTINAKNFKCVIHTETIRPPYIFVSPPFYIRITDFSSNFLNFTNPKHVLFTQKTVLTERMWQTK